MPCSTTDCWICSLSNRCPAYSSWPFSPRPFSGRHTGHRAVHFRQVRRVDIAAANVVAYADGERVGPLPLTVEVVPGAIRVLA
ncbi:hypothetical protein [Arthrobacter sp. ISL-69]|uniref:hypothetical protein n=1 Tax=Arthrobacter sp. ISL-69 TaxID=2819113 RepID=UPI0020356BE9|nr:hypothetical protein [Arthrobacter sp. ISL-69]